MTSDGPERPQAGLCRASLLLQPDVLAEGSAELTPAQGESQPPPAINLAGHRIRKALEDSPASITSPPYHPALLRKNAGHHPNHISGPHRHDRQLERLADVADMPNVDLRVMQLDREIALLGGSFVIMSFGSGSTAESASLGDVVFTENLNTELYIGETDTYLYRLFFRALAKAALSPAESRDLIVTTIERAWS